MKKKLALLVLLLSIFCTPLNHAARAALNQPLSRIVCTESSLNENTNEKTKVGEIIVTLDKNGHPISVEINRKKVADLPPVRKVFELPAKKQGEVVSNQHVKMESTTQGGSEVISARDLDGRSLILNIQTPRSSGTTESSYVYEYSKIEISSTKEFTTVSCEKNPRDVSI